MIWWVDYTQEREGRNIDKVLFHPPQTGQPQLEVVCCHRKPLPKDVVLDHDPFVLEVLWPEVE